MSAEEQRTRGCSVEARTYPALWTHVRVKKNPRTLTDP